MYGASGFIGGALCSHLRTAGHDVQAPARDEIPTGGLGHVVYAIGLTGDFRSRPLATVDAHVTALTERLRGADFDSWLYLSSTRVYRRTGSGTAAEDSPLVSSAVEELLCYLHITHNGRRRVALEDIEKKKAFYHEGLAPGKLLRP